MTRRERLFPWSGFVLGAVAWAVSHQWGSDRVTDACLMVHNWSTFLIGFIAFCVVLVGAGLSWRARQESVAPTARFVAAISLSADLVFGLAILFHTTSAVIIPRCFS